MNLQLMLKDSITHDYQSDNKQVASSKVVNANNPQALKNSLKDFGL